MPTYDYRCEANDRVVEVRHGMNEVLRTWGDLCDRAGVALGDTAADAPVKRLITSAAIISNTGSGNEPPCATGGGCPGGMCGF